MMTLNNRPAAMSRRRPKRQRNPTTIYSDDRPNTFATKRWKGQIVYGPEQPPPPTPSPKPKAPTTTRDADDSMPPPAPVSKRGPGRPPRKKSLEWPPEAPSPSLGNGNKVATPKTNGSATSAAPSSTVVPSSHDDDDDDNNTTTPPVKRKRGRPPKNRSTDNSGSVVSPSSHSAIKPPHESSPRLVSSSSSGESKSSSRTTQFSSTTASTAIKSRALQSSSKSVLRRKRSSSVNSHSALLRTPSWTAPQDDLEGTLLNHPVTLAPILPPILKHDNHENDSLGHDGDDAAAATTNDDPKLKAVMAQYPAVFNDGGVPKACTTAVAPFSSSAPSTGASSSLSTKNQQLAQPSQLPSWTPLCAPPVYFEDDYDRDTGQLDVDSILPVTRKITALTVRKPRHDYLALGDSAGFVLIYSLDHVHRPVARLESVACQQRARPEQERLRAELRRKRAKAGAAAINRSAGKSRAKGRLALMSSSAIGAAAISGPQSSQSILMDTADTTIHALGMIGERVVLATSVELECMDVPSATSLWVCPLSSNRFVTSLDMHLQTFDVLVSCSKNEVPPSSPAQPQQVSSLMLLQHSKNNVEICDANSPMLVRSPSCTAIWDVGCNNRLMFIALSANRQELELVLVSGGSIEHWKVACKTKIPIKSGSASSLAMSSTKLTQSPGGEYTLVASSRGIRLYQTESLQLIHVYGDQLSLHGQAVMWKDCWLAGSFYQEGKGCHKTRDSPAPWLEIDDWLAYSNSKSDKKKTKDEDAEATTASSTTETTDLPPYIVGVPHVRGPRELCETLHVWKVEHASVVPSLSIPLPHKSDGALGLAGGGSSLTGGEDRIILVTNDGQGHALLPKLESNFAGIMYPPGYQVVTDNIEFIEEEDALDEVVQYDDLSDADGESEDEEVNIFEQAEEEDIDEELKEAMRQSLLEHQRQEEAREAMKHDQDVDIVVHGPKEETGFLPCRPEPYLRQFVHTQADDDDEEEEEEEARQPKRADGKTTEDSANADVNTEMSTGAAFISHVLEALPNMEKPQPMEDEDCLSFTTTKVVVAVNPVPVVPSRPGRGRKSRPGNLEAMIKASINPYLQSMMLGQQGVPTDGSGSRLAKGGDSNPPAHSQPGLSGDGNSGNYTGHSTPDPKSTTADEAAVALGLLGLSPSPNNAPSKPTDVLASLVAPTAAGAPSSQASAYLSASSLSSLHVKPCVTGLSSEAFVNVVAGAAESLTASSDRGSVTEESVGDGPTRPKHHGTCKNCHACRGRHVIHTCGKRALPIDYDEVAKAEREKKEKEEEEKKRLRAEKRRLADQRRREAKKQKQRELEEQRIREEEEEQREKERQRRLQEDFASQDLNRQRRDQIVASYAEYQEQGSLELNSVNYSRPQVTPATEMVAAAPSTFETFSRPQVSSTFEELSRPRVGSIFEQASRMMDESVARKPASVGEATALYNQTTIPSRDATAYNMGVAAREQSHTAPAPLMIPPPPASPSSNHLNVSVAAAAAQLEALDGLAALAELARVTPAAASKPDPPSITGKLTPGLSSFSYAVASVAPPTQPPENSTSSFSYAASHGFGSGVSGEVRKGKGIPSYATIRGQANGGTDHAPITGGIQHTVETYTWPPRREQQE